jgi:predicted nucleic acid-binding protein
VIVADTGAILALIDRDDRHHEKLRQVFDDDSEWILPWAILPEVDYLLANHVSQKVASMFLRDLAESSYAVEWGEEVDLIRADELCRKYASLRLGLVDGVVIAVAERLGATAIATVDVRHFGAVKISGAPKLFPRDR